MEQVSDPFNDLENKRLDFHNKYNVEKTWYKLTAYLA